MSDFDQDDGSQYGDYQDDDQQGDGLVQIQWRHGDKKAKTPGYFFLGDDKVLEGFAPSSDHWQPCEEYFESTDTRSTGWKAEQLPVAIVCARAQPYIRGDKNAPKVWLDEWPKNSAESIAMHADVLLIADGLQDLGVVKWSTGGSTVSFAIIGRADPKRDPQGGILHRIREEVLRGADKVAKVAYRQKKKLYWLFWVTVASEKDAKGQIVYTPTKGPMVTIPRLILPAALDTAWLKANYVGSDMAAFGEAMRQAYDGWRLTKFTNDAQPAKAQPAGRNVPVAVTEEDLPF